MPGKEKKKEEKEEQQVQNNSNTNGNVNETPPEENNIETELPAPEEEVKEQVDLNKAVLELVQVIDKQNKEIQNLKSQVKELQDALKSHLIAEKKAKKKKKRKREEEEEFDLNEFANSPIGQLIIKSIFKDEEEIKQKVKQYMMEIERYRMEGYMAALSEFRTMLSIISKLPADKKMEAIKGLANYYDLKLQELSQGNIAEAKLREFEEFMRKNLGIDLSKLMEGSK